MQKKNRIFGYDLIRSYAICMVFLYHIINRQVEYGVFPIIIRSLSSSAMALFAFISAMLLSDQIKDHGEFLIKRFSRIYLSLILCLSSILLIQAFTGEIKINQHTILHFMGLTVFFSLLGVESTVKIGQGLWFISTILGLYMLFPLLQKLFSHRYAVYHLICILAVLSILEFIMWGTEWIFVVVGGFAIGVFIKSNRMTEKILNINISFAILLCIILFSISFILDLFVGPLNSIGKIISYLYIIGMPVLFWEIGKKLPIQFHKIIIFFAGLSYEFYILHFYFINKGLHSLLSIEMSLFAQIGVSFVITFIIAYLISRVANILDQSIIKYLLKY